MYSTCIHCQRDLGRNTLLEHLPIGRRLAYDESAGRVWVICAGCSRWNLVPFESRWEAIEEAEKTYRGTPLRASTDQVGLAKTREGSELVRIGKPLLPELASWRYGRHFTNRRWKYAVTTLPLAIGLGIATNPNILLDFAGMGGVWWELAGMLGVGMVGRELNARLMTWRTLATLPLPNGNATLARGMLHRITASTASDGSLRLWVPVSAQSIESQTALQTIADLPRRFSQRWILSGDLNDVSQRIPTSHYTAVTGDDASAALRMILPIVNETGARGKVIEHALSHLTAEVNEPAEVALGGSREQEGAPSTTLYRISRERRLALEIAVHADSERRWLDGEMASLLDEWRRADEIASIADALLRDPAVEAKLDALRETRADGDAAVG